MILSPECDRADRTLYRIGVKLNPSVVAFPSTFLLRAVNG
jgi:hypothetical protein